MISDQELLKIYYDPTLSAEEARERIAKKMGKSISEQTLLRHLQKIGKPNRKELGIRKNKFGHLPNCKYCDYLIPDCICNGHGIAHG